MARVHGLVSLAKTKGQIGSLLAFARLLPQSASAGCVIDEARQGFRLGGRWIKLGFKVGFKAWLKAAGSHSRCQVLSLGEASGSQFLNLKDDKRAQSSWL